VVNTYGKISFYLITLYMPNYIELRRRLYYAVLTVPRELREELGLRFVQSTGTSDRRKAILIASQLVAGWRLQIEKARGSDTSFLSEAIQHRQQIESSHYKDQKDSLEYLLLERAEDIASKHGKNKAKQFYDVAVGSKTLNNHYFDNWKAQLTVTPRTIQQYIKDATLFVEQFPVIEDVNKQALAIWLDDLSTKGVSKNSQKRILKGCRNYWNYLSRYNIKSMEREPFDKVIIPDKGKKRQARDIFEPHEVANLWNKAKAYDKHVLADLIALAVYTGARIEELCSLEIQNISDDSFNIIDSKTVAGIRTVPIHSHIKPLIKRLKENSTDGYLITNVGLDKYGGRSGALSNRFSRFKNKLGYGRQKVFHSFRHTLITALINSGVMEYHVADIVGHEKKGMTGKTYTHTISLDVKREAIERVRFPLPEVI
jgi:integrase